MNYYPFHIGDYLSATRHLSWEEDAAYRRLLDCYYTNEKPFPEELRAVCRLVLAATDSQRAAVQQVLSEFFELTESGWVHHRADKEINAMRDKQQKQRDKANKRWNKPAAEPGNAEAMPRHAIADATALKIDADAMPPTPTPTPTPTPNSVANATDGEPSKKITDPDEIIFGYGVPLLVNAGTADKQARSFLGGLRKQHGDQALIDTLRQCVQAKPLQPLEWLAAALPPPTGRATSRKSGKPSLYEHNQAAAQEAMRLLNEGVM